LRLLSLFISRGEELYCYTKVMLSCYVLYVLLKPFKIVCKTVSPTKLKFVNIFVHSLHKSKRSKAWICSLWDLVQLSASEMETATRCKPSKCIIYLIRHCKGILKKYFTVPNLADKLKWGQKQKINSRNIWFFARSVVLDSPDINWRLLPLILCKSSELLTDSIGQKWLGGNEYIHSWNVTPGLRFARKRTCPYR
jgi:hypothetical protein